MINTQRVDLLGPSPKWQSAIRIWRFGQLIANVAGWADQDIWDIEDENMLAAARSHLGSRCRP